MLNAKSHPFNQVITTRFKTRIIRKLIKDCKKGKLLDVGCGSGYILSQIENYFQEAFGIDMSAEALDFGRRFTDAKLMLANAEKLPFDDSTFDCVVSTDAFEHIPDDLAAVKEVWRVLKEKGSFIVYSPTQCGLLSKTKLVDLYHTSETSYLLDQRYYTKQSLKNIIEKAGLKVNYIGYHNVFFQEFFTQLLKWVSYKSGKKYEHQADIDTFLKSKLFPIYKWIILPLIILIVRIEEFICENIFRARIPGHRLVLKCTKE
jgi:ubiquinone/menaquinone biosynthesis C-methylase UbiE